MASSASPPSTGAALIAQFASTDDADVSNLTVEQWLKQHLEKFVKSGEDAVDDAVDALLLSHKQQREELRNWQHQRAAEQALKSRAAKLITWDVVLTIESTGEGGTAFVGRTFTLAPRQRTGGMCRIGRSTGADFCEPRGASLPFDCSISVWHGKFTAVYGQIFFSDLNTRNGSTHNGCGPAPCVAFVRTRALLTPRAPAPPPNPAYAHHPRSAQVPKDKPILLSDGDELGCGDVRLRVNLRRATVEEIADQENAGAAI